MSAARCKKGRFYKFLSVLNCLLYELIWFKILNIFRNIIFRKLHRIFTRLMIQVTMKDQCLSEPSEKTLKRIERAEHIDDWVKDSVKMYMFLK